MLRRMPVPGNARPLTPRGRQVLWMVMTADVMAAVWMLAAGDWLDRTSALTAVITLGGHHVVVFWLAVAAFATLGALAPMTGGFSSASSPQLATTALAGVVSVVALAGVISLVGFVVGVVLLVSLLGRAFVR